MLVNCLMASFFFLFSILRLASCSEPSCTLSDNELLEVTPDSLSRFGARLTNCCGDSLAAEFRNHPVKGFEYQRTILSYLIGSVAIFGRADGNALAFIRKINVFPGLKYPLWLSERLAERNDADAVVQFVADTIDLNGSSINPVVDSMAELIEKGWSAMRALVVKILAILGEDKSGHRYCAYRFILRLLPAERQFEVATADITPLQIVDDMYSICEFDPLLKELLASETCSHDYLRACSSLAKIFPHFKQFLDERLEKFVRPCLDCAARPSTDIWHLIFKFLDVGTLFALPLVCRLWKELHRKVLADDPRIHDLYLKELLAISTSRLYTIMPWKHYFPSRTEARKYLGHCIVSGALDRIGKNRLLCSEVKEYIDAVMDSKVPIPKNGSRTLYDSFLDLFERVHKFGLDTKPALTRPDALSEAEYERAINHFVCEKRWALGLSRSWCGRNMARLFTMIGEDEVLMGELMIETFGNFTGASVALVVYGQTNDVPSKLARLLFGQTVLFGGFVEPTLIAPTEYYSFIIKLNILPELMVEECTVEQLHSLVASLLLSLRGDREGIERIVASIVDRFSDPSNPELIYAKWCLRTEYSHLLKGTADHSPEEISFLKQVLMRCGLLDDDDET